MADPKRPVEILRTIHSFDPCLACASHVISADGRDARRGRRSVGGFYGTTHTTNWPLDLFRPNRRRPSSLRLIAGRKYVWEFPIRLTHWVNVIAIPVLFFTGLYIATPILTPSGEPCQPLRDGHGAGAPFRIWHSLLTVAVPAPHLLVLCRQQLRPLGIPIRSGGASWWADLTEQVASTCAWSAAHSHGAQRAGRCLPTRVLRHRAWLCQILTGLALYSEIESRAAFGTSW